MKNFIRIFEIICLILPCLISSAQTAQADTNEPKSCEVASCHVLDRNATNPQNLYIGNPEDFRSIVTDSCFFRFKFRSGEKVVTLGKYKSEMALGKLNFSYSISVSDWPILDSQNPIARSNVFTEKDGGSVFIRADGGGIQVDCDFH